MTIIEYIEQYFPNESEGYLEQILWGETGFPAFWHIGRDGDTPLECFKIQIARAAARENFGEFGYYDCEYYLREFSAQQEESKKKARRQLRKERRKRRVASKTLVEALPQPTEDDTAAQNHEA